MTIFYRETDVVSGRWTQNVFTDLSAAQIDEIHWTLDSRITATQAMITASRGIVSITSSMGELTFNMSDSTSEGPFTMPVAAFLDRGSWTPDTPHAVNDTFDINGTLYRVIFPDPGQSTFDAGANDGAGHNYFSPMISVAGNALATGGIAGMVYTKTSPTDFAATWAFVNAIHVTFNPSTGSSLTSDNVAAALEELESLIHDEVDNAHDVIFTPSTGSTLVSTNVADALEELDVDVEAKLPLAGGTMTGAITLSADPASALQPATKQYVDGIALNLGKRGAVRVLDTTDSDPATSGYTNGATVNGVTLVTGDQVLRNASGHQSRNGIWVVVASGGASRAPEYSTYDEHPGTLIAVEEGSTGADTIWLCTSNVGGTLDTTAINFNQSTATGALLASNNLSDLANAGTARTNLGLGTSATHATGDFAQTANNLSDLANAATARTNLGVAIGTNVQAFDPQLFSNIPQNSKSANYTTVLTDAGKHIFHPDADTTARTITIDSNANVAYPIGTPLTFVNGHGAGVLTIAITADTMRLSPDGTTGSRTLAADGIATAIKIGTTEWKISGTGLT